VSLLCRLQNDFFRGGAFPLAEAETVVPLINKLRSKRFDIVIMASVAHPVTHVSLLCNHPGTQIFSTVPLPGLGPQNMWPDFCIEVGFVVPRETGPGHGCVRACGVCSCYRCECM
jgi:hypothetical protein